MKILLAAIPLLFILSCGTDESWDSLKQKTETAFQNKNYSEAVEYLEDALDNEPDNPEIHYYLGQAYRLMLFTDGGDINRANIQYAPPASEHFKKASELSPKYTGRKFVLDPYSKIQSVWSSTAVTYLTKDQRDSAVWAFKEGKTGGGFYPAIMEYNKNVLASCEKDAILFTNGDNDTFPMWFLQLVENYRTDITVVNVNLLNTNWYIKQLKESNPFGKNMEINLSDAEIDSLRPKRWTSGMMEIPSTGDDLNKEQKIEWLLRPTLDHIALRVQDLMIIEILKSNNWKRPVYFSATVDRMNRIGLDDYLPLEGLVLRLNSHKCSTDPEKLYSNLINTYTYNGVNDKHLTYADDVVPLYQNYRIPFLELASFYSSTKQTEKAKEVFEMMRKVLPEHLVPYNDRKTRSMATALRQKIH